MVAEEVIHLAAQGHFPLYRAGADRVHRLFEHSLCPVEQLAHLKAAGARSHREVRINGRPQLLCLLQPLKKPHSGGYW